MGDEKVRPEDVEATGIFLRLVGASAPEEVVRLLLSAPLDWLAQALAEIRAREWERGRQHGQLEALRGMVDRPQPIPDGPSQDELHETRGEVRDPDSPSGWSSVPLPTDYPGGRWPGRKRNENQD